MAGCGGSSSSAEHSHGSVRLPMMGGPPELTVEAPPAIKHAGGRALAEFDRGRTVFVQTACLACHRLAGIGNPGPGPDLTHVAERLPRQAIERTLRHPVEPMPAFTRMPPAKFRALVFFLSELH